MIVSCEHCRAQFHLDDAKIPESGARVRCSRCNHAFFIEPPGQADEYQAEQLAREALESVARPEADDGENAWVFNHDGAQGPEASAPLVGSGLEAAREAVDDLLGDRARSAPDPPEASEAAPEEAADPPSEAALGSPEGWNFFEDAEEEPAAEVGRMSLVPRWQLLEQEREQAERAIEARAAAAQLDDAQARGPRRLLRRLGEGIGWMATAGLLAAGAWGVLPDRTPAPAAGSELRAAGFRAAEVQGRWIENAVRGPLYLVSGRLRHDEAAGRALPGPLALRLLDRRGEAVAAEATPVGPPFPEPALRERDPGALRASQQRAALHFARLHRGETAHFQALFADVPPDAARFDLELMER